MTLSSDLEQTKSEECASQFETFYSAEEQRASVMQVAKASQKALLVDTRNIIAVKTVNRELSEAVHCIYKQFDGIGNLINSLRRGYCIFIPSNSGSGQ